MILTFLEVTIVIRSHKPIRTYYHSIVVSSNLGHGEVYSIQLYVIKFVSDLQQVSDFPVSSTNKTNSYNIAEILLKVALNTITTNPQFVPLSIFGGKFSIMSIFISVNNNVGHDLLVIIARLSTDLQHKTFIIFFIFSMFMLLFYWKKKLFVRK